MRRNDSGPARHAAAAEGDRLRAVLREKAAETAARAGRMEPVARAELRELEGLARLVEIRDAAQSRPSRRWPLIALLGTTVLVVSVLFFVRVPRTEIELELVVDELSFTLPVAQRLTDVMNVQSLALTGLYGVELPTGSPGAGVGRAATFVLLSPADRQAPAQLSMAALIVKAGTRVTVRKTSPDGFRLTLEGHAEPIRVDVVGSVRVAGEVTSLFAAPTPRPVVAHPDSSRIDMDAAAIEGQDDVFAAQLLVSGLSFLTVEEQASPERSLVRPVSTIREGRLYLESINGREVSLRRGEVLRLRETTGEARELRIADSGVSFLFHGTARGVELGRTLRRSLMPTWLEWLRARHGLSLFWGSVLYLFGLSIGLLRWWGVRT